MSPRDEPAFYSFDTPWTWNRYCVLGHLVDQSGEEQGWTFNMSKERLHPGPLRAQVVWPGFRPYSCMADVGGVLTVVEELAEQLHRVVGDEISLVPTTVRRRHRYSGISVWPTLDCVDEMLSNVVIGTHVVTGSRTYDFLGNTTLIRSKLTSHLFRLKYSGVRQYCSERVRQLLLARGRCNLAFERVRIA